MKRLCVSELLNAWTFDALRPMRRKERLRLMAVLRDKAAAREIINVSEEFHKASNNGITRMVTRMRECDSVDEVRELVKGGGGDNPDIQLGIQGRIDDVYRRFDEVLERIIRREEEERRGGGCGMGRAKELLDILLEVAEDDKAELKLARENIKCFILFFPYLSIPR
ncbi:Cytochrome P450 93A2 [Acorus gramineus]|uniref:Cytochrome P450 93A2 n=1 Tax=Acorus gramineus TaxID=55184 RepID=A0AAV9B1H7_ACOGR|nr:Cytochrome P450 93A2 [Acorus gramineus]